MSLEQVKGTGFSARAAEYRVDQGRWVRLWRGIFLVGPGPADPFSLAMGAVLTTDGDGVLYGRSGLWLWGVLDKFERPIEVAVTRGQKRARPGIKVHSVPSLDPRDITRRKNIPVTTPARALFDHAAVAEIGELERVTAQAQVKRLVREKQLLDQIDRNAGRRGVAKLKAVLDGGPQYTTEESERIMLQLLRDADLPRCETQAPIGRYVVDFYWPDHALIVEVEGFAAHGHRRAFEYDARRQQVLAAAGNRLMPVTWLQMRHEPIAVAVRIGRALGPAA